MILCICNYRTEEDIKKICEECCNKEEFLREIEKRYRPGSCRSCYESLLSKYEEGNNEAKP